MYIERRMFWGLCVAAILVLLGYGGVVFSLHRTARSAMAAADRAAEAAAKCRPCGATLTRASLDDALRQVKTDLAALRPEVRELRDQLIAARGQIPDLDPLAHFLRFAEAYTELLLEGIARRSRVDVAATRQAVERMFADHGGKPQGWFWGPLPP